MVGATPLQLYYWTDAEGFALTGFDPRTVSSVASRKSTTESRSIDNSKPFNKIIDNNNCNIVCEITIHYNKVYKTPAGIATKHMI